MHTHIETGISIASDVVDRIIALDALLGHCDQDDQTELAARIAALDPSEVTHILNFFGVKAAQTVPVTVAVSDAGAEKARL